MRRLLWTLLALLGLMLLVLIVRPDAARPGRIGFSWLTVTSGLAVCLAAFALTLMREQFSRVVERGLIWAVAALLLALGYSYRFDLHAAAYRGVAGFLPERAAAHAPTVEIARATAGGFPLSAQINGARVAMVLDTGANSVVLTQEAARAAGLPMEVLAYTVPIDTANGRARAAPVTIDNIAVGGIVEHAVPALIAQPGHLRTNLLGMSFLNRMERWEVSDDKLVLRGYP